MIIRTWIGTIINILFVVSVVEAWYGELVQAGILLITLAVVNVFYNGLAYTIFWGLCGLGILLLGYEKRAFGLVLLALAAVIMAADMILWIRAIKRDGMRGLLRVKITDRPKIYARRDFYKENEITCILWNKLKQKSNMKQNVTTLNQDLTQDKTMTNDERKKAMKFLLTESICVLFLISGMACLLYEKFVWTGILFIIAGAVNIFFIPHTNVFIVAGLVLVSLGYEKRELVMIFGAVGLTIVTANAILMHKSIASGGVERLGILAKSNRFAFFGYLRENEITCILLNKLKRRLNWTKTDHKCN
jgi:hypothetical protein